MTVIYVVFGWPFVVQAQQSTDDEQLDQLYIQLLSQPDDLGTLYNYAQRAIALGNYEAAISAMEGMLVVASNQPRILFELGTLYHRLGALQAASSYLKRAKKLTDDKELIAAVDEYLLGANREIAKSSVNGTILIGNRYQTNANGSPDIDQILGGGRLIALPPGRQKQADHNLQLFGLFEHRYDLSTRSRVRSDLVAYITDYQDLNDLNYQLLEVTSGVEWLNTKGKGQWSARPHIVLRKTTLSGNSLETAAGVGTDFSYSPTTQSTFLGNLQFRDLEFDDHNGRGISPGRSGDEARLRLTWNNEFKRGQLISWQGYFREVDANVNTFDFSQFDLSARYHRRFNNIFTRHGKQSLSLFLIRRLTDYDAANPSINPNVVREDKEWRAGVISVVPIGKRIGLHGRLEFVERDSNIVNHINENTLISIALRISL